MKLSLLRRKYNVYIISFILLSSLFGEVSRATPACPIITQSFQNSANGDIQDASATGWYLDATNVTNAVYFAAMSHRIKAQTLGGEGVWYSRVFSVSGYTGFQVDAKVSSEGALTSSEYVKVYYKLDNGPETLISAQYGNFGTPTVTSPALTGSTVQIVIRIYNFTAGNAEYYIENYDVFKETGPCTVTSIPVTISPTNSGVLTCTNPSLTLSAGTTATGTTTYSWTGPNGFISTSQNPVISTAGTYTVVGTNAAGSGAASYTVAANNSAPDITATGAALACASSVIIHATSSVSGATYSWTGPNSFTSSSQNPTVTAAGTYTVTVKNPANGCTASQTVTVTAGAAATAYWLEDFTLPNGTISDTGTTPWTSTTSGTGTYSVQNNEFKTSFSGQAEGVWTSGIIDISKKSNTVISVDLRSETASSGDAFETADYIRVYYKLNSGAETLVYEDLAGIGTTTTGTASITISSAALNGSTLQVIIKTNNSDPTERYYFDNVKLTGTNTSTDTIKTSVSGVVTCNTTAQLFATASSTATAYSWTGPNGFTSTTQNPVVSAGGQYIVTATLSGGCTISAPITVTENKTAPDITASGGVLACLSGVTLNVNSAVSGATYNWTGPNSFTSTAKNPVVSAVGTYTATVTNPANGCAASQSVQVTSSTSAFWLEDFTLANGTISDSGPTGWSVLSTPASSVFSVQNNEFRVSNTGTVGTTSESVWASSVINITGKSSVSISAAIRSSVTGSAVMNSSGTYMDYLRFYYKLNGGSEVLFSESLAAINNHSTTNTSISVGSLSGTSLQIIVRARASGSDEFYYFDNVQVSGIGGDSVVATGGAITCTNASVTLSGSSTSGGATYSWTGPNNFTSTAQNPTVSTAGVYTLTVSNPTTGCTGTDTANVILNTTPPGATAGVSGPLTCTTTSVTLSGSSSTSGVSYAWTGPNSFSSATQNPAVTTAGTYNLTVTNPANGCTSTASVPVTVAVTTGTGTATAYWLEDFTLPNGTTSDTGATAWTSATTGTSTGTYSVQNNEFKTSFSGQTEGVWTSAIVDISGKSNTVISVDLRSETASSSDFFETTDYVRVYYKLDGGPETLVYEDLAGIGTTTTGTASITVSSAVLNGSTLQVIIKTNNSDPTERYFFDNVMLTGASSLHAVASASGILTCSNTAVALTGSSSAAGATYNWTGPNNFSSTAQNPTVGAAGIYTLTVTSGACATTDTALVGINNTLPGAAIATPGNSTRLTCLTSSMALTGSSSATGANYAWSGPNGFSATGAVANALAAGAYTLTVTNPANGCSTTASVTLQDRVFPGAFPSPTNYQLTCTTPSVIITGNTNTSAVSYSWTGPNGFTAATASITSIVPGDYNLLVTDTTNACQTMGRATVTQNISTPGAATTSAPSNSLLTCTNTGVTLTGSSSTSGVSFSWTGPNSFTATTAATAVTVPGAYTVMTTDPVNGCSSTATVTVGQDTAKPNVGTTSSVPSNAILTCAAPNVILTASSSTAGVTYNWTATNGFTATGAVATVSATGSYTVTVTNPTNGCSSAATATVVTQNIAAPSSVTAIVSSKLSCSQTSVTLTANSTTTGATYTWTGPGSFTSSARVTTVALGGTYTLVATNPADGCTITKTVAVVADTATPANLMATNDGPLTCSVFSVTLTGSSSTAGTTYQWTGPNGFFDITQVTTGTDSGTYTLIATNPANGCIGTTTTTVTADFSACGSAVARHLVTAQSTSIDPTGGTAGSTDPATQFEYKVYPNPVSTTAFITLRSPQSAMASVEIYNTLGVREAVLFNNTVEANQSYQFTVDAGHFNAGVHYCMIRVNNKVYTTKLVFTSGRP